MDLLQELYEMIIAYKKLYAVIRYQFPRTSLFFIRCCA